MNPFNINILLIPLTVYSHTHNVFEHFLTNSVAFQPRRVAIKYSINTIEAQNIEKQIYNSQYLTLITDFTEIINIIHIVINLYVSLKRLYTDLCSIEIFMNVKNCM